MAPPSIWATRLRYALAKMDHSAADSLMRYHAGEIRFDEFAGCFCKSFFQGKLTSAHWADNVRREMSPTIHNDGAVVLVRRLLDYPNPIGVFVGDLVMVRDPERPSQYLTRRLAAIEGCEMVSTDEKDEPFILPHNHCWVLADNQSLTPKTRPSPTSLSLHLRRLPTGAMREPEARWLLQPRVARTRRRPLPPGTRGRLR